MPQPLGPQGVADALTRLDGWTGDESALRRAAALPSFRAAIEAVTRVADVAEDLDHHPDIDIRWRRLTFTCSTHAAGSRVTDLDVQLATRIEAILGELGAEGG